jgi:hypothetical protein
VAKERHVVAISIKPAYKGFFYPDQKVPEQFKDFFANSQFIATAEGPEHGGTLSVKLQLQMSHDSPFKKPRSSHRFSTLLIFWVFLHHIRTVGVEGWQIEISYDKKPNFTMTKILEADMEEVHELAYQERDNLFNTLINRIADAVGFYPTIADASLGLAQLYTYEIEKKMHKLEKKLPKYAFAAIKKLFGKTKYKKLIEKLEDEFFKMQSEDEEEQL